MLITDERLDVDPNDYDVYNTQVLYGMYFRSTRITTIKIEVQDQLADAPLETDNVNLHDIIPPEVNRTGDLP